MYVNLGMTKVREGFMKKIVGLFFMFVGMAVLAVCLKDGTKTVAASVGEEWEKLYDDIAAGDIGCVSISGNARSIVIKQSVDDYFEFYNADLNAAHTYEVSCNENGDALDIRIMMENADEDKNILGSVVIVIPQKEFEIIDVTGDFKQVFLHTMNSDVYIHDNSSSVNLDIEADHLEHNITLDGSESNTFRNVSLYFDKLPDNVKMELNLIEDGTIDDPQGLLEKNRLELGSGEPVISINNTEGISVYSEE